jgi:predicted RNase H-like HicB family nuclease
LYWEKEFMKEEFTAIVNKGDSCYIAFCPEVKGAWGQGRTIDECMQNLQIEIRNHYQKLKEPGN